MKQLAIIIPAYKDTFLDDALKSIASQTCLEFTLYVGDDHSPYNIKGIVDKYRDKIDLVYKRFDENLGGKDLVAQWERCIDMNQGEEWLWLFSDDDVMEPGCVADFFRSKEKDQKYQLFHFNVKQIDSQGNIIKELKPFPHTLSAYDYLDGKFHGGLISYVVEFIVQRDLFYRNGRFENFDMAWGSDMITWVKLAESSSGIVTVEGNSHVRWRSSDQNISPNKSRSVLIRKLHSIIENEKWIKSFLRRKGISFSYRWYRFPYGEIFRSRHHLTVKDGIALISLYGKELQLQVQSALLICFWVVTKILGK